MSENVFHKAASLASVDQGLSLASRLSSEYFSRPIPRNLLRGSAFEKAEDKVRRLSGLADSLAHTIDTYIIANHPDTLVLLTDSMESSTVYTIIGTIVENAFSTFNRYLPILANNQAAKKVTGSRLGRNASSTLDAITSLPTFKSLMLSFADISSKLPPVISVGSNGSAQASHSTRHLDAKSKALVNVICVKIANFIGTEVSAKMAYALDPMIKHLTNMASGDEIEVTDESEHTLIKYWEDTFSRGKNAYRKKLTSYKNITNDSLRTLIREAGASADPKSKQKYLDRIDRVRETILHIEKALLAIERNNAEDFAQSLMSLDEHLNENYKRPEFSGIIRMRSSLNKTGDRYNISNIGSAITGKGKTDKDKHKRTWKEPYESRLGKASFNMFMALGPAGYVAYKLMNNRVTRKVGEKILTSAPAEWIGNKIISARERIKHLASLPKSMAIAAMHRMGRSAQDLLIGAAGMVGSGKDWLVRRYRKTGESLRDWFSGKYTKYRDLPSRSSETPSAAPLLLGYTQPLSPSPSTGGGHFPLDLLDPAGTPAPQARSSGKPGFPLSLLTQGASPTSYTRYDRRTSPLARPSYKLSQVSTTFNPHSYAAHIPKLTPQSITSLASRTPSTLSRLEPSVPNVTSNVVTNMLRSVSNRSLETPDYSRIGMSPVAAGSPIAPSLMSSTRSASVIPEAELASQEAESRIEHQERRETISLLQKILKQLRESSKGAKLGSLASILSYFKNIPGLRSIIGALSRGRTLLAIARTAMSGGAFSVARALGKGAYNLAKSGASTLFRLGKSAVGKTASLVKSLVGSPFARKALSSVARVAGPIAAVAGAFDVGWEVGKALYENYSTQILDAIDEVVQAYNKAKDWLEEKINVVVDWTTKAWNFITGTDDASLIGRVKAKISELNPFRSKTSNESSINPQTGLPAHRSSSGVVTPEGSPKLPPPGATVPSQPPLSIPSDMYNYYNKSNPDSASGVKQSTPGAVNHSSITPPIPMISYADSGMFLLNAGVFA